MADVEVTSAQIKDGEIVAGDMTAATTGWFVDWDNIADMPAGFADGTDDDSGGAPEGTAVLSTGEEGGTKFLREDGDGTCSWQAAAGGGTMNSFHLEDDDGTEVEIDDAKEVKFIESTGLDINWTDTSTGSDADPFDMTFTIDADAIAGAVTEGNLADSVVVSADIKDGTIVAGDMTAGTTGWFVDWDNMADVSVTGAQILDDTVDSADYAAGSIDAEHLAADIIDETKIADDGIDSEHYNDASIDAAHLAADIIDETKIADDGIDSEHYNDGSIDYAHISAGVVDYMFEKLHSTFTVCISTPGNLTAGEAYGPIDDVWEFATTITTMTMTVQDGVNCIGMVEQRAMTGTSIHSAGTDVWSGDVTADATWRGGTFSDATVPSMYGLFYVPTSAAGNTSVLYIKGARTKD